MKTIAIVNGVNLGELGTREVNVYGYVNFDDYVEYLRKIFPQLQILYFQSNFVGEIVDFMLKHKNIDGFVLNAGAFTHQSMILSDTIKAIPSKVIEVHITNLFGREEYRKKSYISSACIGNISGFGLKSYDLALFYFIN